MERGRVKQKRSFNGHVERLPNKRLHLTGFSSPLIVSLDGLAVVSRRVNRSVIPLQLNKVRNPVCRPDMGAILYIVRDAIMLKGPGLVVVAEPASEGASLRVGDTVELRSVDGSSVVTAVEAFPMVNPYDFERQVPISFRPEVSKEDVPIGTEVWSYP